MQVGFRLLWALCCILPLLAGTATSVAAATFDQGMAAYEATRYEEAAAIWLPLAEKGEPRSQHAMGKLYEAGLGVRQSYVEAVRWYGAAAVQGLPGALNNLALLYNAGHGVERDPLRAASLWREAAQRGHVHAQYNLGLVHYMGQGVPPDDAAAAYWFWQAAAAGLAEAQFAIAQMYRLGVGTPPDPAGALLWFDLAAAQGHADATRLASSLKASGVVARMPTPPAVPSLDLLPPADIAELVPKPPEPEKPVLTGQGPPPRSPKPPPQESRLMPPPVSPKLRLSGAQEPIGSAALPPELAGLKADPAGAAMLWLGTADSEADAWAKASAIGTRFPELFASLPPEVIAVALDDRSGWRVVAGPLGTLPEAELVCAAIRRAAPALFCAPLSRS